jgi:hypothetical protein
VRVKPCFFFSKGVRDQHHAASNRSTFPVCKTIICQDRLWTNARKAENKHGFVLLLAHAVLVVDLQTVTNDHRLFFVELNFTGFQVCETMPPVCSFSSQFRNF